MDDMGLEICAPWQAGIGNSPVIITGAGGWLGQAALEMVCAVLPRAQVFVFGSTARVQRLRDGSSIPVAPLTTLSGLEAKNALVFHHAFLTREHASAMPLAAYMAANREISETVQTFIRAQGARGLFVPSSGAAYTGDPVHNPYGALKLEDEWRFAALGRELSLPVVNMRVFNLAGPFINKLDSYALACILADLMAGRPVRLRAANPVWRGYAHVADVLKLALGLMLEGGAPPVFDSGGEAIELSDLAARAARLLGKNLVIDRPADWAQGPPNRYVGDAAAFEAHAARLGLNIAGLDEQILDTADYLGRCLAI